MIGASRITYSMATYRQIPEVFRRLHPRFKTPWLSIVLFAGVAPIAVILPGDVNFVGTLYSFGATLSFTVAHASLVRMRMRPPARRRCSTARGRTCGSAASTGRCSRSSAGSRPAISFLVILAPEPGDALGRARLDRRRPRLGYVVYRRRCGARAAFAATVKAPPAFGPALALEYRRLLVPVLPGQASDDALDVAASLAAERGAQIVAVTVIEIPLDLPLGDRHCPRRSGSPNRELDEARAIGDSYGVSVIPRLLRGRSAGAAIVEEAERRGTEIIVIGAPRKDIGRRKRAVFGHTVDYVLKNAPCRVMVTASTEAGVKLYRERRRRARARPSSGIGVALLAVTAANGGGVLGFMLGGLFVALGVGRLTLLRRGRPLMARKLRGFQRVLDAPALFSVAYGEIASSLYFALGIVAAYALGLTPARAARRRRLLPDRLALVRGGDGGDPGDGRRGHLRPARVQRPRRLPDRLGALPRLPDRDRALDALPAALPRRRARHRRAARVALGRRRRRLRDPRRSPPSGSRGARSSTRRDRRRGPRPRDAAPARHPRARAALLAGRC